MFKLPPYIVKQLQKLLEPHMTAEEEPREDSSKDQTLVTRAEDEPARDAEDRSEDVPSSTFSERAGAYITDRWQWLRTHLFVVLLTSVLLVAVLVAEHLWATPGWREGREELTEFWQETGSNYRVTILLIALVLIAFLASGIPKRMREWPKPSQGIAIGVSFILIALVFAIYPNVDTWRITAVVVMPEDGLSSEAIAMQFQGNLNAIGAAPFDTVALSVPNQSAVVDELRNTSFRNFNVKNLCPQIMLGPNSFDFRNNETIILPRSSGVRSSRDLTGGQEFSFTTAVGTFSFPMENIVRFLLRGFPGYRELHVQVILANRSDDDTEAVHVVVNDDGGRSWTVSGPRQDLPQLMNFLAYRIVLDSRTGSAGSDGRFRPQVDNADLALTLGNQAFALRDFASALAYYRLAESLRSDDVNTQMMLGLTLFRLGTSNETDAQELCADDAQELCNEASQAFKRAQDLEPHDFSLNAYQACLDMFYLDRLPEEEEAVKDSDNKEATIERLIRERTLGVEIPKTSGILFDPSDPKHTQERKSELSKKPPLGPGRYFSVFWHEPYVPVFWHDEDEGAKRFDLYYLSGDTVYYALDQDEFAWQPNETEFHRRTLLDRLRQIFAVEVEPSDQDPNKIARRPNEIEFHSRAFRDRPRQIFAVKEGLYYVTSTGEVNFFQPPEYSVPQGEPSIQEVVSASDLEFENRGQGPTRIYGGGIRQIFGETDDEGDLLFLLDRFGGIQRMRVTKTNNNTIEKKDIVYAPHKARQIFLDDYALYFLRVDGSIWRVPDPRVGDLQTTRQLISNRHHREIVVENGVIYALLTNGNIWRYVDREGAADRHRLIDAGHQTRSILIAEQGLLVLKDDGKVWLIRNLESPRQNDSMELKVSENPERLALNVIGSHLIMLEPQSIITGTESIGLKVDLHEDPLPTAIAALPTLPAPTATATPTNTATPTATPSVSPTPIPAVPAYTPTPAPSPTREVAPEPSEELTSEPTKESTPTSTETPEPELTQEPTEGLTPEPTEEPTPTSTETPEPELTQEPTEVPTTAPTAVLVKHPSDEKDLFWMDRTEVTNEEYLECINSGDCSPNKRSFNELFLQPNYPVVGVNWEQAQNFCEHNRAPNGRLPTVAEWYAAVSPDGRIYPWGNTLPNCDLAVVRHCNPGGQSQPEAVGSRPAGATDNDIRDLIGNVWEWTATKGAGRDDVRVTLGGSFSNPDGSPQGGYENFVPPNPPVQGETRQTNNLGFRCVWDYEPMSTPTPAPTPRLTAEVPVKEGKDDAEGRIDRENEVDLDSWGLELTYDTDNDQGLQIIGLIGLRFQDVDIPKGAEIRTAYIEFESDEDTRSGGLNLSIVGESSDNAQEFSETAGDISDRPTTEARVAWEVPPWDSSGVRHRTAELRTIVEEIVGRPGWQPKNAIVFIIEAEDPESVLEDPDQRRRIAESYDATNDPDEGGEEVPMAPVLHVELKTGND